TPDIELSKRSEGPERKIEGDLPNAIKVDIPFTNLGTRYNYFEDRCPGAGDHKKDRILGCAIMFINAGSEADFVYLMNQRRNSGVER
ncbi:uncharacterized protein METZ01_LOCUS414363, partial [marine metagenome]